MNAMLEQINSAGLRFVEFAWPMLVQSSVLIVLLLILDFALRKRVRAVFRYWIWMLVLAKLVLPTTLSTPVSLGYWFGDELADIKVSALAVSVNPADMPQAAEPAPVEIGSEAPAVTLTKLVEPAVAEMGARPTVISVTTATWQGIVFLVWLTVMVMMGLLLLQRVFFVSGLVAQARDADNRMTDAFEYCCERMGVKRKIRLKVSANTASPAVCGLFRPVVLVPENLGPSLKSSELRAVLMHELAHIKRGDLWVNLAQTVLQIAYFYNPLLWLANCVIRRVREQAVDEAVQVAMGANAQQYPETLVNVAKLVFGRPALSLRLIGVVESKSALKGRIKRMLNRPIPKSAKLGILGLIAVIVVGCALLPMAAAENRGQKTDDRVERQFIATLPNGVTVELVGACDWPETGRRCWRPDGSALGEEIYVKQEHDEANYGFVVKVDGPEDLSFTWRNIEGAPSRWGSCEVLDYQEHQLDGFEATVAVIKDNRSLTSIRIGIAAGPWSTIASHEGTRMISGKQTDVLWSQAFESRGATHIVASSEWRRDRAERVVAIDKEGVLHTTYHGSVASGKVDQLTATFKNLKLGQIKEFQYQVRPYEWVDFKNVSLRPGVKTNVQIEVEKPTGEKGKVVEGVDITPANFDIRLDEKRGVCNLVVSIENQSDVTTPKFKLRFYRGDSANNMDEAGNVHSGWHEAGPIEPSKSWNECTRDFHLPDGQHKFNVVLDYDDNLVESDETNNRASMRVIVKDGHIIEKSVTTTPE